MQTSASPRPSWVEQVSNQYAEERGRIVALVEDPAKAPKKMTRVAGVECFSDDESKRQTMSEKLQREADEELRLRQKLNSDGVPFKAVLPTKLFKALIAPLPFYTFKGVDNNGKVQANVRLAVVKIDERERVIDILGLSVSVCYLCLALGFSWHWAFCAHAIMSVVFAAMFLALNNAAVAREVKEAKENRGYHDNSAVPLGLWIICGVFVTPYIFVWFLWDIVKLKNQFPIISRFRKADLWPTKTDEGAVVTDSVRLLLPQAPTSVQKALLRLPKEGFRPYLVVHENAFEVSVSDAEMQAFQSKYDPIVCFDYGNLTVIVDHYGDVPEEAELVNAVKRHFNIVQDEYLKGMN